MEKQSIGQSALLLGKFYKATGGNSSEHYKIITEDSYVPLENLLSADMDTIVVRKTNNKHSQKIDSNNEIFVRNFKKGEKEVSTGDIVLIKENGSLEVLFFANSNHNALFVTNRCNNKCIMCPQPPIAWDDTKSWKEINLELIDLIPKGTKFLGITGGEPSLLGNDLYILLQKLNDVLPDTEIDILTNGRAFAWMNNVKRLAKLNLSRVMFAIPLHSDYKPLHDFISQASGSFEQTIMGLHNLARYNSRIEIRIVLSKQSVKRLKQLSKFVFNNLPFVEHVAFMGLEYIGYAPFNDSLTWINPREYSTELLESVQFLAINGVNVSIYNLPDCVLPENLRKYCRKSISDWKRVYWDECINCCSLDVCGGVFASSRKKMKGIVKPIMNNNDM